MIRRIFNKIKHELQFGNTHYYTRVKEKAAKTRYNHILLNRLQALTPIPVNGHGSKLTVAILANKKNLYESLATLYSFCFWRSNIHVHYHEDGSLDDKDILVIKALFPGIVVFKKSIETPKVTGWLTRHGYDSSARLRGHFLFAVRLFDMLIEKTTPYLLQLDSDVLFFDEPVELLNIVANDTHNGCYNVDDGNSYTFTPDTIAKYLDLPVLDKVNAGLLLHNFNEDFFAFADNIIKNEPQRTSSWHLEQTLFALYASYKGDFLALPKQYDLGRKERNRGNKITSEHYCHSVGYDFHKDFIYKLFPLYSKNKHH